MWLNTNHKIPHAISSGKFTKYNIPQLIPTSKMLYVLIPMVFANITIKDPFWEKICKLRVTIFALVHGFYLLTKLKSKISI